MSIYLPKTVRILRLALILVMVLGAAPGAALGAARASWAGGDASDGHSHAPNTLPAIMASPGTSRTSLHLRLSDLAKSGPGTEAPLQNAGVSGVVKEAATGKILSRISAHSANAPGTCDVHFGGDNETFAQGNRIRNYFYQFSASICNSGRTHEHLWRRATPT